MDSMEFFSDTALVLMARALVKDFLSDNPQLPYTEYNEAMAELGREMQRRDAK